jgi:hypothetical protein
MFGHSKPIATFKPNMREIKLYSDHIEFGRHSGSLRGVTAAVTESGSKRLFVDSRRVDLTIVGPDVSISHGINPVLGYHVRTAHRFAAEVNSAAMRYDGK